MAVIISSDNLLVGIVVIACYVRELPQVATRKYSVSICASLDGNILINR